jgi:hypothetical protein
MLDGLARQFGGAHMEFFQFFGEMFSGVPTA